jgi:hypothetical protein
LARDDVTPPAHPEISRNCASSIAQTSSGGAAIIVVEDFLTVVIACSFRGAVDAQVAPQGYHNKTSDWI